MGHQSDFSQNEPGVVVVIHGLETWLPLDQIEVSREWAVKHGAK
jgi:hypothetical protein